MKPSQTNIKSGFCFFFLFYKAAKKAHQSKPKSVLAVCFVCVLFCFFCPKVRRGDELDDYDCCCCSVGQFGKKLVLEMGTVLEENLCKKCIQYMEARVCWCISHRQSD